MAFNISPSNSCDLSSSPSSGSIYGSSTPPSSWTSTPGSINMATSLTYSNYSRSQPSAKSLLPSVLAPNRKPRAMPMHDAILYIRELLDLNSHNQPQPRTITIVFYDVRGRPFIVTNLDEFRLEDPVTLEFFVTGLQSMLDGKTEGRQLLVSRFEFRSGSPRLPPIMGQLYGSKAQAAEWVLWPTEGSPERHYFDLYQHLLLRGISLSAEKPILKVRTVQCSENITEGHLFNGKLEEAVNTKGKETPLSGKFVALDLGAKLRAKVPADLNFDAPEFKLMARFIDELKISLKADLAIVYGQHLRDGEQPIKGLLIQRQKGYSGTNLRHPKEFSWVGPEHLTYNTIKPRATDFEDATTATGHQGASGECAEGQKQSKVYEKRELAPYWFEDTDDETYFPAAGKGISAAISGPQPVPDSVNRVASIAGRPVHVRKKSRADAITAAMNQKVLERFRKTVATPSSTSPTRTFPALYGPSMTSSQISTTITPTLQPPNINRARSPLKQSTPTTSQLRAESPAFTFDSKSKLINNVPAVTGLLRLIQKEGVTTATSRKTSAESAGDSGAQIVPLQGTVASPSPLGSGSQTPIPEANTSRASPAYDIKQAQSNSNAPGAAITVQTQPQLRSQSQTSSASTTPAAQHPNWYTTLQAQTAAPPQNLPHPPASRGLRPATSRLSLKPHHTTPQRVPQNNGHYYANLSTHSSHNLVSGTTTLSFPTVAHPQPQTSAKAANAFKEYQAMFDKENQVVATTSVKEVSGVGGPSDPKGFQFVFGNFTQPRVIKSPKFRK